MKTNTLVYFSSKVVLLMIKSHDEYQSIILIGLAHAEKAYSKNRSIFVHNRSYWRELRPLVTPWAWRIKEGVEPWRFQKRLNPSHVQVSLLLSSHSPLSLFPNGHYMCAGYLTHTISPAGLVALHRCRLSHLYSINSFAFSSYSLLLSSLVTMGYLHLILLDGVVKRYC